MVFKKIVKFLCCFLVWIQDFIKKLCISMVLFEKKLRYLKYKISTKFHHLLFFFYFFSIFGILFSISPIQTCPKIKNFLWCFIRRIRDFTSNFWKILKVLLKKLFMCEIFFFSKFCGLLFVYYFFIIFDILFSISSICTCQKFYKFL